MLNRLWIFFVTLCVIIVGLPLLFLVTMVPYLLLIDFVGGLIGSHDIAGWIFTGLIVLGFAWIVSAAYYEGKKIREETIRIEAETDAIRKARANRSKQHSIYSPK